LLELRREVLSGKNVTIEEIKDRCDNHVTKQRAAMLSLTMRADRDSGLGRLLQSRLEASPGSDKWKETDHRLAKIDRTKEKRVPDDRHEQRMSALYVDPVSPGRWNRPVMAISRQSAYDFVTDARNEYSIQQCDRYTNLEILKVRRGERYCGPSAMTAGQ
jgi:AbiV family abortive infection protein